MFDDETPVAWTNLSLDTPVVTAGGAEIGTTEEVIGDQSADIFHGLAVKRSSDGSVVELPAARIKKMTKRHILTDLAEADAASLTRRR
ncbi:MAG TPA: hypothetical protein VNA65_00100 [Candidatus Dormibacteraeota bacterium]|nr:hypothetical protein [Candidatus Dormibacteraeota bacterium]